MRLFTLQFSLQRQNSEPLGHGHDFPFTPPPPLFTLPHLFSLHFFSLRLSILYLLSQTLTISHSIKSKPQPPPMPLPSPFSASNAQRRHRRPLLFLFCQSCCFICYGNQMLKSNKPKDSYYETLTKKNLETLTIYFCSLFFSLINFDLVLILYKIES